MRLMLLAAGAALLAGPASAQSRHAAEAAEAIDQTAPAIDRTTQALLNLDIGPILDAADPTRPHHHRTVRDMARRDDPDFDRHLRASIYGNAARMRQMTAALAAAEPALRQTLMQLQATIGAAIEGPAMEAPPLPPGDVDDDWDRDQDDDPPPAEPYEE
jgi:hypothetical protein